MVKINYVKILQDNYVWLIEKDNKAIIVDPGVAEPVIKYLKDNKLEPFAVLITHSHSDHIAGIPDLIEAYPALNIIGTNKHGDTVNHEITSKQKIDLLGLKFNIFATPGHTKDHISYYSKDLKSIFCGDVLFPCGCGRIFSGKYEELFFSLRLIIDGFSDDTKIYAGHEYGLKNAEFALNFDKNNLVLQERLEKFRELKDQDIPTLPTTVGLEKATNPFVRVNNKETIKYFSRFLPNSDPMEIFKFLREEKNKF